jgi:predicted unusual protein kinase regulating ubiquinone biosynthesis (AarF/ABC1/UbiB family)
MSNFGLHAFLAIEQDNGSELARDARIIFEKLGPTYVKMGQMMSVRPDVLPQSALDELAILQVRK